MRKKKEIKKRTRRRQFNTKDKAWVVSVDMGYGHQRAAYPLKDIAYQGIINANDYLGIPLNDRKTWKRGQNMYEKVSRLKHLPLLGEAIFGAMDYFQRIEPFYPKQLKHKPTLQLRQTYSIIRRGWGSDLIRRLNRKALPLITTFFIPAYCAEEHGYKGEIFMVVCDADVSRAWAPLVPKTSRIQYLVPNKRVKDRLALYGVNPNSIFVTGFPLPQENIGNSDFSTIRSDLGQRICHLDPLGVYQKKYEKTLDYYLGKKYCIFSPTRPLTITFAVGGAGAQREIGADIIASLRSKIDLGRVCLNLIAGVNRDVNDYFQRVIREYKLSHQFGKSVNIVFAKMKFDYFEKFNTILRTTDILWTKPSELVFYSALGIPIIIAPPMGSQEVFNRSWLESLGAGITQLDASYTHEWLFDWLQSGWLAEAAVNGFLDAPKKGVYHIGEVVLHGHRSEIEEVHLW